MDILNHRTFQVAEEHRKELLRDVSVDREDVPCHRLELHRSRARSSPHPADLLPHIVRRLGRTLIARLPVVARRCRAPGVPIQHVRVPGYAAGLRGAPLGEG